jgi:hypothetical protein
LGIFFVVYIFLEFFLFFPLFVPPKNWEVRKNSRIFFPRIAKLDNSWETKMNMLVGKGVV